MAEYASVVIIGIRIKAILVVLAEQSKEFVNILFVDECVIILCAEKLSEVESHIFIHELME